METSGTVIDWAQVKHRLSSMGRVLAEDFSPTVEAQNRILQQRARVLARVPDAELPGEKVDVLEFSIADEQYAFETESVREIVALKDLTSLPGTPPYVQGVVNIRGRIVSALDLRCFFGMPHNGIVDLHRLIVLRGETMEFGVLVDRVGGVALMRREAYRQEMSAYPGILGEFAVGFAAGHGLLLNAQKLLRDPRLVVNLEMQP